MSLPSIDDFPESWRAKAQRALDELGAPPAEPEAALRVLSLSSYAQRVLTQQPDWCAQALADNRFAQPIDLAELGSSLADACADVANMSALQAALRTWRNRYQLWIVYRHLMGRASVEETTGALSALADACLQQALSRVYAWESEQRGVPIGEHSGKPQALVVLALGKLGARELNLSSDIDLIFFYPETGQVTAVYTNQQFFVRVGQRLIEALDRITADGFVFRVDMRLRPYGDSGPLVMHFDAAETYYASAGRDWERYAFIKARACAGDVDAGEHFLNTLRRFVFRRYLDFGALTALREMKQRLLRERNDPNDVKLGPGGIRDAEFAVQLHQLIWGGREPRLQSAPLLQVVPEMIGARLIDAAMADDLVAGYRFLRDVEHSLQAFADEQTQALPDSAEGRQRLALAMGFADAAAFQAQLDAHRERVAANFADLLEPMLPTETELIWSGERPDELDAFDDDEAAQQGLQQLWQQVQRPSVAAEGRERLQRLMPHLLAVLPNLPHPDAALRNVLPVLRSVLRRSAYLVLLYENPAALARLLNLCQESAWLADQLTRVPMFLDALLDERQQHEVPPAPALHAQLVAHLRSSTDIVDAEVWVDGIREFKELHGFQAALGQVQGSLPLMRTSDYLTFTAEAVLREALALAWRGTEDGSREWLSAEVAGYVPDGFAVLAFGKLGGIELGPGSDLDLVFIHDLPSEQGPFLHRLVRRLVSFLTLQTQLGPMFEIDTRLRPSGRSGSMVTNPNAMRQYYADTAWTWEHQALVRARPVAGDPSLCDLFSQLRLDVLCQPRDLATLRKDILEMRERMRRGAGTLSDTDPKVLKQERGGMVDIEFMVQYLVLAHAHDVVELARFSDNVRILEAAQQADLLPEDLAQGLRDAYLALRTQSHRNQLELADDQSTLAVFAEHQSLVRETWKRLLES